MGFFNDILNKIAKNVSQNIENEIKETVSNALGIEHNTPVNNSKSYTIPEKYYIFPKYEGTILTKPIERDTSKYCRITIRYQGKPNPDFISKLLQNGFVKGSDVRYDRANTYVIVDELINKTEIVYHIKKEI